MVFSQKFQIKRSHPRFLVVGGPKVILQVKVDTGGLNMFFFLMFQLSSFGYLILVPCITFLDFRTAKQVQMIQVTFLVFDSNKCM